MGIKEINWNVIASPSVVIGVSGGADSMALLILAKQNLPNKIIALTVDHGLRPESAAEAQMVKEWCRKLGVEHHTLKIEHTPTKNIQAWARKERYRLLEQYCNDNGINCLMLAHHLDDQIETFYMNLERGSGLDGLTCMLPIINTGAMTIVRPLLDIEKSELVAFLRSLNQPWIEDPSNQNKAFTRIKIRNILANEKVFKARLATTIKHLQRVRASLEEVVAKQIAELVMYEDSKISIQLDKLLALPEENILRILTHVIVIAPPSLRAAKRCGNPAQRLCAAHNSLDCHGPSALAMTTYKPRFKSLMNLYNKIKVPTFKVTTLNHCKVMRKRGVLVIVFE